MLDEGVYTTVSEIGDAENISKSYVIMPTRSRKSCDGRLFTGGLPRATGRLMIERPSLRA
jgi:hypothetical protein